MYRLLLILGLMLSVFIFTNTTDVQAGAFACDADECIAEDDCLNLGNCAVGGGDSGIPCAWIGECVGSPGQEPGACCGGEMCVEVVEDGCVGGPVVFLGAGTTCEPVNPCLEGPPSAGPTVIVPTMTQWGIIFASIILGAIGIVAIIREKNMDRYFK